MWPCVLTTRSTSPSDSPIEASDGAKQLGERVEVGWIRPQRANAVAQHLPDDRLVERRRHAQALALGHDQPVQILDLGPPSAHHILKERRPAGATRRRATLHVGL